jgi:hypothetical protein
LRVLVGSGKIERVKRRRRILLAAMGFAVVAVLVAALWPCEKVQLFSRFTLHALRHALHCPKSSLPFAISFTPWHLRA